jgi:hypothetical protein
MGLNDGHTHGGGTIWCHGGIDGRPGKVNALMITKDGSKEDGGGDFLTTRNGVRLEFAGSVCAPNSMLAFL